MAPGETNTSGYLICQTPPHRNREGGAVALEVTLNGHEDDQTPGIDDWGDRPWTGPWATPLTPAIDNLGYRRLPVAQHTGYVGATFSTTGVLFRYEHLCENAGPYTGCTTKPIPQPDCAKGAATKIECTYHEGSDYSFRPADAAAWTTARAASALLEAGYESGAAVEAPARAAATRRDCCEACARQNGCANFVHDAGAQRCVLLPHVPHHQHELYKTYGAEERGKTVRYGGLLVPNPETVAGVYSIAPVEAGAGAGHCRDWELDVPSDSGQLLTEGRLVSVEQEDGTFATIEVLPGRSTLTPPMGVHAALEFYGSGKHIQNGQWEGAPFQTPNEYLQ
jgi:hypothetical protein